MAIIPQVITEDRASGGQVIDGSLKFDSASSHYLNRTPVSAGNRRTWTWSGWVKRSGFSAVQFLFTAEISGTQFTYIAFDNDQLRFFSYFSSTVHDLLTSAKYRDPSAWYHVVVAFDSTQSTSSDRAKLYVNGTQITAFQIATYPSQNVDMAINNNVEHRIGREGPSNGRYLLDGYLAEVNFIDGSALDASDFGFTDPLTNTWRPKKYTGTYGTNGFYLPMDGNSPIGQDKTGNGNDWTPVNFGGSNTLEKATGALPILNTTSGGNAAIVGVRTDTAPGNGPVGVSTHLVLALPLVGNSDDVSNRVNSGTSNKSITTDNVTFVSTQSNFYGGSSFFTSGSSNGIIVIPTGVFDFGTGDYTIEFWAYLTGTGDQGSRNRRLLTAQSETGTYFAIYINSGGFVAYPGASPHTELPNAVWQNKWTHFAYTRESGTAYQFINGVLNGTIDASAQNFPNVGYQIGRYDSSNGGIDGYLQDFRVYKGVSKYTSNFIPASTNPDILPDTPSGVAGGSALATLSESTTEGSVYFDGSGDYLSLANDTDFDVAAGDFTAEGYFYFTNQSSTGTCFFAKWADTPGRNYGLVYIKSGSQYRFAWSSNGTDETLYTSSGTYPGDVNRWVHIAVVRNGTTLKVYRDGEEIISGSIGSGTIYNSSTSFMVGRFESNTNYDYSGWISNFRFVKGTAVYTSEFTPPQSPLTNITNTKLLCCKNSSSATDSVVTPGTITANGNTVGGKFRPFLKENINTVRGQESGWCTLNPVARERAGGGRQSSSVTLTNGNLSASNTADSGVRATMAVSSGKWYYEATKTSSVEHSDGVGWESYGVPNSNYYAYYRDNGSDKVDNVNSSAGTWPTFTNGDVIGAALDLDANTITFYKNGILVFSKTANTSATEPWGPGIILRYGAGSGAASSFDVNFGQKPFKYNPPEGFKTLCLANLPRPTEAAVRPDKYFKTVLYTGNGSTQTISGLNFSPDVVWLKSRSGAFNHALFDTVRTAGYQINPNLTDAETLDTTKLSAFTSDGFTLGNAGGTNGSGSTFAAWCWKAGGAAVSNSDGSITSQVSANQDAGFSICGYTGQSSNFTWGHGLGVAPSMVIIKRRNTAAGWSVYHKSLGATKRLQLDQDGGEETMSYFQNTEPTSTVFSVTTNGSVGADGDTYVAYCFAEVESYSKIGSFVGNGSADGPFVFCGFRPAYVWLKGSTFVSNWNAYDSARSEYNAADDLLRLNSNAAEVSDYSLAAIDLLSNGFKIRTSSGDWNSSGQTFVFCAFAEAPTNNLFGGQANAR